MPDVDDAMLERLEADLATIEAAMDRVDSGDLEGYGAVSYTHLTLPTKA